MIIRTKIIFTLLLCSVFFSGMGTFAIGEDEDELPPWMERVDDKGRRTYTIPKGAIRKQFGNQVIVEPPNEYVARRIYEIENYVKEQFLKYEKNQEKLRKEFADIKQELSEVKKAIKEKEEKQLLRDLEELVTEKKVLEEIEVESIEVKEIESDE